jgi:hypothetical protein
MRVVAKTNMKVFFTRINWTHLVVAFIIVYIRRVLEKLWAKAAIRGLTRIGQRGEIWVLGEHNDTLIVPGCD